MQHDQLEKFILANREAFDDAVPSLEAWAEIDRRMNAPADRRISLRRVLSIAAGVLFLLFSGAIAGHYLGANWENRAGARLLEADPEFQELARYYEEEITEREQQLATYRHGEAVLNDLAQLDRMMEELRAELLRAPKGKEKQIVENLIKTYQTKVQILERVLHRIELNNQPLNTPAQNEISI